MANGDDSVSVNDSTTVNQPSGPTSAQEQDINKQLFGTPSPPPSSQTDSDKQRAKLQQDVTDANTHLGEIRRAYERSLQENENYARMQENALRENEASMKLPVDSPPQPPTSLGKANQEQLGAVNQIGSTWPAIVGLGLAIGGMIGKHHGAGVGTQMFIGSFLKSYAEGKQQAAKQQQDLWWKNVELEEKEYQERLDYYKTNLENNRYTFQQKMELLKTSAQLNGWERMRLAAEKGDVGEAQKALVDAQRALDRYNKEATKTGSAMDSITHGSRTKEWLAEAYERYEQKNGRLPKTDAEQAKARRDYLFTQWEKEHPQAGKKSSNVQIDPKTGRPIGTSGTGTSGGGDSLFGVGKKDAPSADEKKRFDQLQQDNTQ
jgi:hypothetical protein